MVLARKECPTCPLVWFDRLTMSGDAVWRERRCGVPLTLSLSKGVNGGNEACV